MESSPRPWALLSTLVVLLVSVIRTVDGQKKGALDPASTNYVLLDSVPGTNQSRAFCLARGACRYKILTCPEQCPERKPQKNRKVKGCFIDCSSKCEATCMCRKNLCSLLCALFHVI